MYNLNQFDVRSFFFDLQSKAEKKEPLTDLEKIAYSVILEHPEYNNILQNKDKYLEFKWSVENGETNPFLHLSMHLSILEQLSIDQPVGIKNLFEIYLPIADEVMIFDNSEGKHDLIAKKTLETEIDIFSETKFTKLKNYYHANT